VLFPQTAVYALRAMAVLATLEPDVSLTAAELADRTGVPSPYLSKVMRRMVRAGLVEGRKGHGGGFRLGRPAGEITFAEVLAAAGVAPEPGRCAFDWQRCNPRRPCVLHPVWSRLQDTLDEWARGATLGEIVEPS
jgi:Rrf2 family iron-sulfur cluster assembly transcriptional regulator